MLWRLKYDRQLGQGMSHILVLQETDAEMKPQTQKYVWNNNETNQKQKKKG